MTEEKICEAIITSRLGICSLPGTVCHAKEGGCPVKDCCLDRPARLQKARERLLELKHEGSKRKKVTRFEAGKYYVWNFSYSGSMHDATKGRPLYFNYKGGMDKILDGRPHKWTGYSFEDVDGSWSWHECEGYFDEVTTNVPSMKMTPPTITLGRKVTKLEKGKYYVWNFSHPNDSSTGERPAYFASSGSMDGILDGKPHKYLGDREGFEGIGTWYWKETVGVFNEVPAPSMFPIEDVIGIPHISIGAKLTPSVEVLPVEMKIVDYPFTPSLRFMTLPGISSLTEGYEGELTMERKRTIQKLLNKL